MVFATRFTVLWHSLSAGTVMSYMIPETATYRIQVKSVTASVNPLRIHVFFLYDRNTRVST